MRKLIKENEGFIQIPLLIAIIVSIIGASVATTGVVLHKQRKLAPFVASISQAFKGAKDTKPEIKPEEPQPEKERSLLKEINREGNSQAGQELKQAKLELEKAKQEAEEAKAEAERLKAEQEIKRIEKEQQEELRKQQEAQRIAIEEQRKQAELKKQIVGIEQILSESSNIRIACLVVGAGNYIEKYGTEEEMKSLSENYEETKNECFQYHIVYSQIANFVAEPELASVKQRFSQIGNVLREFGVYVMLDKGLDGKLIDIYEKDLQELITQTREEILKVKRLYNLEI